MDNLISEEVATSMLLPVSNKPKCIHAIGCIPKEDGGIRPITDCSRPDKLSINNHMDFDKFSFHSVDSAAQLITQNCYFAIVDLSKAYRSVPIHPSHWQLQGLKWNNQYYVDTRLCFGLRCAPSIFHRISSFITRCMARRGYDYIINYLDDFCMIHHDQTKVKESQQALIQLLHSLGFSVSWPKVVSPTQVVKFLGIILDSVKMEMRLPNSKLKSLQNVLHEFSNKSKATKRQLQN